MNSNITTKLSDEAESPFLRVGAVSGSCSFLSKPNRIRCNSRDHEFLSKPNRIRCNSRDYEFLSKPNRICCNSRDYEFLWCRNTITANYLIKLINVTQK